MIPLLLDMGLPRRAAEVLEAEGWDAAHVGARGIPTAPDDQTIRIAAAEGRVIGTPDHDFSRLLAHSRAGQPSVIHLRLRGLDHRAVIRALLRVVPLVIDDPRAGCMVSVQAAGVRVRRLPIA
jgi:predicted nuclease of predicted toxin-antitoxin system